MTMACTSSAAPCRERHCDRGTTVLRGSPLSRGTTALLPLLLLAGTLAGVLACHDLSGLAGTQSLPAGIPNPSVYHTASGAVALYQSTLAAFQGSESSGGGSFGTFYNFVINSGLLTDELQSGALGSPTGASSPSIGNQTGLDARLLPEGQISYADLSYTALQGVRNDASEALGALAVYDDTAPSALRGQLYALQGYVELLLADLFCSGVPLSTLDFTGDYTYVAGDSTTQIYRDAIIKFNTALPLLSDSARIVNLTYVGKGRAWLALGQYDSAAAAAAHVPDGFAYQFLVDWTQMTGPPNDPNVFGVTVADKEGENGLPFISSGDPRTASHVAKTNAFGVPQYVPDKYGGATPGIYPITVADGIEARLIQAEAALHGVATGQGSWLDQLNALRATAITPALPALTDPGTPDARVDLLFQERASWLFLTGHRQGDLRRLVRNYHRQQDQVYPTGPYAGSTLVDYGADVTAPVPIAESVNPLFHGCLSRGA